MLTKICPICNKQYQVCPSHDKKKSVCSLSCKRKKQEKQKIQNACLYCGKKYKLCKSRAKHERYCSSTCKEKYSKERKRQVCLQCNKVFYKQYKTVCCSTKCRSLYFSGKNCTSYVNGKSKQATGYIVILTGPKKYEFEHRLIMEKKIGRKLKKREVVHHINGIKTDNRIENLLLMDKKDHDRMHTIERHKKEQRFGQKGVQN
jgi:hypothetical protein